MTHVVEAAHAAYDLTVDDQEWLAQLTELVGPHLDRGRGIVAFRWKLTDEGKVQPEQMLVHGGTADDETMLRELLADLDPRRAYLAYGAPYGYRTLSEIAQEHPTLSDVTDDEDMQRVAHTRDVVDFEMLRIDEGHGRGWMLSVLRSELSELSAPRRKLWERVGAHVAAGARLRARLDDIDLDSADAVFDPSSGQLEVNLPELEPARRRGRLLELIEARRHAERVVDRDPLEAMDLWKGLIDGRWSLLDVADTDGRTFTVLRQNPLHVRSSVALSEREREVAFLIGRGHHLKLVAYELGLSASTIRSQLRSALRKLNLDHRSGLCRLVATVRAPSDATSLDDLGVLALADEPLELPESLSHAEGEVARMVYDGLSNVEIATERGTASRTVANQLASIYRKLDVDTRDELVHRLSSPLE